MTLKPNQIKPNPNNPRYIKDANFKKLVQSLKDFPEMAEVREVVVNQDHMILGGNMRYKAMIEAGWTEIPVRVVDWPEDKQQEFVIKDNASGGDWDWELLANSFDQTQLEDWGVMSKAFDPMENPDMTKNSVTEEEIKRKAQQLADEMIKERANITAICPNCGTEFELQA